MRYLARLSLFLQTAVCTAAFLSAGPVARAQVAGGTDFNLPQKSGDDTECSISKNPTNKLQLFALCNTSGAGLFAARSADGGATWVYPDPADKTIADGDANQGPAACCDPTMAWDTFGNLYITYINSGLTTIETLLSTDGGATFSNLATFGPSCVQCVDQPTVVAANTSDPTAPVAVWIVWNLKPNAAAPRQMAARGAAVTGLNMVGPFNAVQMIPGTGGCNFGDVAIAPSGAVVQACQSPSNNEGPSTIFVNTDADGLGAGNFGAAVAATTTNVGGFDFIPVQNARSVDSEAGLAYDSNAASPHLGRLYLVYTEETAAENNDTDIMVRFSDDDGATWSVPIRVNDDPAAPVRSQFLPRIASNPLSGNIAVCWHDSRNSATNTAMQVFCSIATPTGATPAFFANAQISDALSTSNGVGVEFGDYSGLAYFQGLFHPIWADTSNSTGNNPDGTSNFDAYTDRVTGGMAANEGDPHMLTVDGVHYDFQGAGEFVSLRDADGMQIQIRQAPVATSFNPGPNAYTGLATCVSLNTAVAARVGKRRVTFQPNLSGVPDPSGLQLRVDGVLTTLGAAGLDLGDGGRVVKSLGDGIEIEFPNGTILVVTPNFWTSEGKWYLNVNVYHTPAMEGTMGAIARGSWLPILPDGTSLGPKPASLNQRYTDLNQKFADAWRVTDATSLFDYAPGTSTASFTFPSWPLANPPCVVPANRQVRPLDPRVARRLCRLVAGKNRNANCVFDVTVTGEPGFAKLYLLTQRIEAGSTTITVSDDKDPTQVREPVTFTALVSRKLSRGRGAPTGVVQFILDGSRVGATIKLDARGRARWRTSSLKVGNHQITARYIPVRNGVFLPSSSLVKPHAVRRADY
jgi:hypothetical protein